ncbi:striatin-4 isoform X2 [Sceloporus undulatus]|uniref:striatin-4 isoform X2 n=1 Tax=Sceloporus undulatus TaxID=8520 RepID=UPI001C4C483D|nr:striatin-4 isoform X2 [Sceloporus undulatus]
MWQQPRQQQQSPPPPPPPPPANAASAAASAAAMEAERAAGLRAQQQQQQAALLASSAGGDQPPQPPAPPSLQSASSSSSASSSNRAELSLPGILHFIQHEWARFEAEKSRWEAERAELQAQVAFLQGERKGQENLKTDLVRRIKMLEYALKQERSKYHKLKFGTELNPGEKKPDTSEPVSNGPAEPISLESNQFMWKEGRQLLRQYLEEVGYTDTILDMRSKRVRALLGRCSVELNGAAEPSGLGTGPASGPPGLNGGESLLVKQIEEQIKRNAGKEAKDRISNTVMEKIPFLQGCEEDSDEEEDLESLPLETQRQHKKQRVKLTNKPLMPEVEDEDDDEDSEDALSEFDFLGSGENGEGSGDTRRAGDGNELVFCLPFTETRRVKLQGMLADLRDVDGLPPKPSMPSAISGQPRSHEGSLGFSSDVFIMDTIGGGEVSLGDLADLTVTNDNELSCDLSDSKDAFKKTWNPKFTLRSHYDGIRALAFHHVESALVTASEDGTLKLWNLQKTVAAKKNAALDVEPVYAFRAHRGPVLSVTMGCNSEYCYSGGLDTRIRCWRIPDLSMDPYDGYDPSMLSNVLDGHTDAVWGLAFSPSKNRLASCSADGTVRIWDPSSSDSSCLSTYNTESENGIPTSITFSSTEPTHAVAAFQTGYAVLYDVETSCPVLTLESRPANGASQINQVVSHPTQPITITAHDDRGIRFLDNRTGKAVHSMVAHLDAVTCLAADPNGVFLMSGSHDCSLRLWNLDNKTCTQEITAHRKKHEEAIHDVAFHPSKALIASAGADALAKVFV